VKVLLVYFSFTGNTEKVAFSILENLQKNGVNCEVFKIEPVLKFKYIFWLFLSFIPSLPFPIKNLKLLKIDNYEAIILGTPKWTFNCPPVTYFIRFLKRVKFKSSIKIFFFLTYGGFGEDAYIKKLKRKFEKSGFTVYAVEKFRRSEIIKGAVGERIQKFCLKILTSINPSYPHISET